MESDKFTNEYIKTIPFVGELAEIMSAGINAVDAEIAVRSCLKVKNESLKIGKKTVDLSKIVKVFVVGAGKAGAAMAKATYEILGEKISDGLVIVKDGHAERTSYGKIEIVEAAHPIPDERCVRNSQKLKSIISNLGKNDLVLVLISGGGSAVSTLPVENIHLTDLQNLTNKLLLCGATIGEINCLRKHLTQLSGGGLAKIAYPAKICSLIISDVVDSPLDVIASGITAPDTTTFADAWQILDKYNLIEKTSDSIIEHLQKGISGFIAETPKADSKIWQKVSNTIIADNRKASEAARYKALELGFDAEILTNSLEGEAREIGKMIAEIASKRSKESLEKPLLLIAGGETTVTIRGDGKGGRNQELALSAVEKMAGIDNVVLITLATDGGDATDAAGAVVDGKTYQKALDKGMNPNRYLECNDSYNFFEPLGALLKTGATLTNVNDLLFLLITPPK